MRIGIVGSGTSGLAAAAFLNRDGHEVTLFERFETPHPRGAGLLIQPTGLACLALLGLEEKALSLGARIHNLHGVTAKGRTIFDLTYRDLKPHMFGLGIHRGALFSLLYDEVLRLNVPIKTSCEIVDTEIAGSQRYLIDKAGARHGPFDLVVDSSGMRSHLREPHGTVCYNKAYPYGAVWGVCEDPEQKFGGDFLRQRYDGAGVMIGILAIGKRPSDQKQTVAFFWSLPASTYQEWRDKGMEPWKQRVLNYWPELDPFLKQFGSVDDLTFAQYNDTIMKYWHYDRLVFIGDAAHCTSPQLGQGANLGLIDAMTLAACLKEHADVNEALKRYTKLRKPHTVFYQLASRLLTPFFQSDNKAAAWMRDLTFGLFCKTPYVKTQMLRTLAGIKTGLFTHLNPGRWHKNYDLDPPR